MTVILRAAEDLLSALAFALAFLSVIPAGNLLLHRITTSQDPAVAFAYLAVILRRSGGSALAVILRAAEDPLLPPLFCLSFPQGICFSTASPQAKTLP